MATPTLPAGIGTDQEVNQANEFIRAQPWYQEFLSRQGQDPNGVNLSGDQSEKLLALARDKGIGISDHFEVDQSGNIRAKSHLGRNLLIAAGIGAGAILAGPAILSAFAGGGGPAATAAAASSAETGALTGAGGALASSTIGSGFIPAIAGGTGLAAPIAAATGAGSTLAGVAGLAGGGSTLSKISGLIGKAAPLLQAGGQAIGAATNAAGNNRLTQEGLGLKANDSNIAGQSAFENELMKRASTEADQRKEALKNVYRAGYSHNPNVSPFNPTSGPKFSPEYLSTLDALAGQGRSKLATGAAYDTNAMPGLTPYTPVNIKDVQGSTGTKKSTLESIGDWLSPALSTTSAIANMWK